MSVLMSSRRFAIGACWLAGLAPLSVTASPPATPPVLAAAYQDRYIDEGTLAPEIFSDDATTSDPNGLARAVRIDAVASALSHSGARNINENGVIASAQWETLDYGAFTLDATARTGTSGSGVGPGFASGGTVTLWQRGLAFDGGWRADSGLGALNSPVIGLARSQTRFYLPTWPIAGALTEWHGPAGAHLVAGVGVPGVYGGIQVPAFQTLGGSTATVGGQWSPLPHWTVGAQFSEATNVNLVLSSGNGTSETGSSRTGYLGIAWREKSDSVQLNLLEGTVNNSGQGRGFWLDATLNSGRYQNNFGIFRLDPGLAWGNQIFSSDTQGGYYRVNYQARQWQFNAGIDEVLSVSGQGSNSTYVTGDARYQYSRDLGFGATANFRRNTAGSTSAADEVVSGISVNSSPIAWSVQGSVDHFNPWGIGRAQLNYARDQFQDNTVLTLDQTWNVPVGSSLSTSASVGRINTRLLPAYGTLSDGTGISIAAYGNGELASGLSLSGNLRWGTVLNGNGTTGVTANASLVWRLSNAWSMLATYYENRTSSWMPLVVSSPIAPPLPAPVDATRARGAFLTLRYEYAAGSPFAPLGGRPGSGAGRLTGTIFLDANENGRMDAGEAVAPNVTVLLDGRFSTRTDAKGRFEFPFVASGPHSLVVESDNMPLQWTVANEGRVDTDVHTRDTTEVNIPAQRLR
jgi:hypothetical protein